MSGKTHLIADESIGGIQREYVEVERKASVGDYVTIHGEEIEKVVGLIDSHIRGIECTDFWVGDGEYKTLEPTDIVHIAGARYRLIDRVNEPEEVSGETRIYHKNYRVLEPITNETHIEVDARHASPEVIDLLANLARRVTSLENKLGSVEEQLADTQGNVEKLEQELATKTHEQSELIEQVSASVEMALDDIVTLDERTQPKESEVLTFNVDKIIINDRTDIDKVAEALVRLTKERFGSENP